MGLLKNVDGRSAHILAFFQEVRSIASSRLRGAGVGRGGGAWMDGGVRAGAATNGAFIDQQCSLCLLSPCSLMLTRKLVAVVPCACSAFFDISSVADDSAARFRGADPAARGHSACFRVVMAGGGPVQIPAYRFVRETGALRSQHLVKMRTVALRCSPRPPCRLG